MAAAAADEDESAPALWGKATRKAKWDGRSRGRGKEWERVGMRSGHASVASARNLSSQASTVKQLHIRNILVNYQCP
jgi:hypothetical protein